MRGESARGGSCPGAQHALGSALSTAAQGGLQPGNTARTSIKFTAVSRSSAERRKKKKQNTTFFFNACVLLSRKSLN